MNRTDLAWAGRFVRTQEWRFSKKMPQWPHWYIVRGESNRCREFDRLAALIERHGADDPWGKKARSYLRIGAYKYWVLGDIINRAEPISSAEARRRGDLWLQRHGKTIGPYGNLISVKKRTRVNSIGRSRMGTTADWGTYLARDPEEDEHERWLNSHCLFGYESGRGSACGTSLATAPCRFPDEGRWVYFMPACGHMVHRSRKWLQELRDLPAPLNGREHS